VSAPFSHSSDPDSVPAITLVTVRSGVETSLKELVHAKNVEYDTPIHLGELDASNTVVIELEEGAFVALDGQTIVTQLGKEAFKAWVSTGHGELSLRLEPVGGTVPWYKKQKAFEMWAVLVLGESCRRHS